MATDATSQATDPTQDGANNEKKKIEYTPEQQTHMEGLMKELTARTAKEEREKAKALESKLSELQAKFDDVMKAKTSDADTGVANEVKNITATLQADLDQYKNQVKSKDEAMQKMTSDIAGLRKRNAMQQAIHAIGSPFHPNAIRVVEDYTVPNIREDESGTFYVVADDGKTPRLNTRFERMSLPEYFTEYAAKEKWLVKSDYISGAGSTESAHGSGGKPKVKAEELWGPDAVKNAVEIELKIKKDSREEWLRLKEEGMAKGLFGSAVKK